MSAEAAASVGDSMLWRLKAVDEMLTRRVGAMILIFFVSLTAVSFPGLSKKIRFLRIPHFVFFVGKHFGTGVILATAFCHLLQDAYMSLQDPEVKKNTDISRWTGLIILGSLLTIFLVEYISTSYVDRLNADPSAPPSPISSPSRAASPTPIAVIISQEPTHLSGEPAEPSSERTPLLPPPTLEQSPTHSNSPTPNGRGVPMTRQRSYSLHEPPSPSPYLPLVHSNNPRYINILGDRDHHRCCCTHDEFCGSKRKERRDRDHHRHSSPECRNKPKKKKAKGDLNISGRSPSKSKHSIVGIFVPQEYIHHQHHHHSDGSDDDDEGRGRSTERRPPSHGHGQSHHHHDLSFFDDEEHSAHGAPRVGRRRQVVGILVLQLGIMIHSLVIGLTLSITAESDFTPLVTAIFFHQLFEGLSLGIRIASLPPPTNKSSRSILAPTLSALFAVTTPAGILIGLLSFRGGEGAQLRLTQGIMSAISAGMLIYASCVEMLAGDFVMDPHMHMGVGGVRRQIVALASLLAGVAGMTMVD